MPKFNLGQTVWYTYYVCDSPGDMDIYSGEIRSIDASDENCIRYNVGGRTCVESELFETKEEAVFSLESAIQDIIDSWQQGLDDFHQRLYSSTLKFKPGDLVWYVYFYPPKVEVNAGRICSVDTESAYPYVVPDRGRLSEDDVYATREEAVEAALKLCEQRINDMKTIAEGLKSGKV